MPIILLYQEKVKEKDTNETRWSSVKWWRYCNDAPVFSSECLCRDFSYLTSSITGAIKGTNRAAVFFITSFKAQKNYRNLTGKPHLTDLLPCNDYYIIQSFHLPLVHTENLLVFFSQRHLHARRRVNNSMVKKFFLLKFSWVAPSAWWKKEVIKTYPMNDLVRLFFLKM